MTQRTEETLLATIAAIGVGFVAVSCQSLWIDEANSAIKAMAPTLSRFVEAMRSERGSDLQMPVYMVLLWGWEKLFGHSEFVLRAMNLPFFAAAIGIASAGLRQPFSTRVFFALFACSSAFMWAYLDEARPYTLQFCAATLVMVPLVNTATSRFQPSGVSVSLFGAGIVLLSGSSLIGAIFATFYALAFAVAWLRAEPAKQILARSDVRYAAIWCGVPLVLLGAYYVWSLGVGAKASGVGTTSVSSTVFTFYEILGFAGLGPGRALLRENAGAALSSFLPTLGMYAAVLSVFIVSGLTSVAFRWRSRQMGVLLIALAVAGACAFVMASGVAASFRVVGRHLMPAAPFVFLGFGTLAQSLWSRRTMPARSVVVCALAVMLSSAIAQRTEARHAKDDYRGAASAASMALQKGKVVWWAADPAAANYYGVFPQVLSEEASTTPNVRPMVFMANNRDAAYLARLPEPDVVIFSKPDVYDEAGNLNDFLVCREYASRERLAAFIIYSRPHS